MPKKPLSDFLKEEIDSHRLEIYKTAVRCFFSGMPNELNPTFSWYLQQLEPINKLSAICVMENLVYYSANLLEPHLRQLGHGNNLEAALKKLSSPFEVSYSQMFIDVLIEDYEYSEDEVRETDVYQYLSKIDPNLRTKSSKVPKLFYNLIEGIFDIYHQLQLENLPIVLSNKNYCWLLAEISKALDGLARNGVLTFPESEDAYIKVLPKREIDANARDYFDSLLDNELNTRKVSGFRDSILSLATAIECFAKDIACNYQLPDQVRNNFDSQLWMPYIRADKQFGRFASDSRHITAQDYRLPITEGKRPGTRLGSKRKH